MVQRIYAGRHDESGAHPRRRRRALRGARMAKWPCNFKRSAPRGMAEHPRSAPGIYVIEKRYPETWRIKGAYSPEAGLAFRKARLGRESIRYAHYGGQVRVRHANAQGGLLQESGGTRSRMEQQGPVLRPGPEQLPPVVRPSCDRRWRNHHSMHRASVDF